MIEVSSSAVRNGSVCFARVWLALGILGILVLYSRVGFAQDAQHPLFVEGYCDRLSYLPGEEVALSVSTPAAHCSIEIVRLGAEKTKVHQEDKVPGRLFSVPEDASSHGCRWPVVWRWTIPADLRSGYYQVSMRVQDEGGKFTQRGRRTAESTCFFVVRAKSPGQNSKILLQLSTNTYNAYNNWGGFSLYAYNGRAGVQGNRVSFLRPPSSQYGNWEFPFVAWAESQGYTLDFAVNSDLEHHPEILDGYRLVLSVGHDEYWSAPMRDKLEAWIASGGNVAFFSGNTCCWQVRSEDQGAALVCWKQRWVMDPMFPTQDHRQLSTLWSHHLVQRPENQLTGVGFLWGGYHRSHGQFMEGSGAYTVHRPEHWLFEGTGLREGDAFGGKDTVVGYECDGCEYTLVNGKPEPTHRDGTPEGFQILATCPAKWHPEDSQFYDRFPADRVGAAVIGIYQKGGTVVTVGSTDWSHGLAGKDPVVERITRTVLERLGK